MELELGYIFATIKVRHSLECLNQSVKIFQKPTERRKRTPNLGGFRALRLSAFKSLWMNPVATPTQGQKNRSISPTRHADGAATQLSVNLLNLFQGLTCKPDREPKLNYTDTSFDVMKGRVSQFSLGGRGLTYFFLTCYLPFPILCNSLSPLEL